uniref:Helitron helicase-like domain-containing protein n=1 Tax=Nicotiana tabacum TaxID=4097 RepID=A0A1S4D1K2_TOBAC|nr:PREDICTED: uncharacterized protein LOC107824907 [Nicotiana tabacum]
MAAPLTLERRKPKKKKYRVLKADNNDSSEENSDMTYLTKKFQKMVKRNGEVLKRDSFNRSKNNNLYYKCGKARHFMKNCSLLKQEFSKNFKRKRSADNIVKHAFAFGKSEDETDAGDSSMMTRECEENKYDSTFALMAQPNDDEDDDNNEFTLYYFNFSSSDFVIVVDGGDSHGWPRADSPFMVPNCKFCRAKKFEYEPPGFCCNNGTVKLTSHRMPAELRNLYIGNNAESKHFRTYIRTYNNLFAFTALGVNYDKDLAKRNRGIYTFRVQGQMYHLIDDLYPKERGPRNLQLYFYDNANELKNRMACSDKLNESTVKELMDILKGNPYSMFLRSLTDMPNLQNFHIALKCDAGLDQRVYNVPTTTTEIVAIWVDENDGPATHAPHLQIYTHSDRTQRVNYYFGCYNPLQYPLLFPYGQGGWHCGIKKFPRAENIPRNRTLLNLNNYRIRNDDEDEILHTRRLLQQYSVDEYIKLETQRLDFVSFNQDLFRMGILQGLLDILRLGKRDASNVGKQTFLPNSFIGGNEHKLLTAEAYDDIIRAELLDDKAELDLRKLVIKHMMHGPCGSLDPTNSCMMKKGLLQVQISKNVKEYRSARWVSPTEAVWRLFGFPISEMSPSVYRLQLHLEGQQFVSFKSNTDIQTIVNNPMIKKPMLTEFFYMNDSDEDAKELNLLYKEFPEYFVWSSSDKFWARRQKRCAVGRIVTCHPIEGERYYLRLLLMHVRGWTSYKDLLTVNGEPCSTFRESLDKRGLLHCDNNLIECMSEAASYQMPYSLRRLFATLLVYCGPVNPRKLWE